MAHIQLARAALRRQPLIFNAELHPRFHSTRGQPPPQPHERSGGSSESPAASTKQPPPPPSPPSSESLPPNSPSPSGAALTLDFAPRSQTESPNERTGARSAKGSLSSIERRRRFMGRMALGIFALGIGFGVVHLGRAWEPDELNGRQSVEEVCAYHGVKHSYGAMIITYL